MDNNWLESIKNMGIFKVALGIKGNVMTSLGCLLIPISITSLVGFLVTTDIVNKIFCAIWFSICIWVYVKRYDRWADIDPNRLQTERYNMFMMQQSLLVESDKHGEIKLNVEQKESLELTASNDKD